MQLGGNHTERCYAVEAREVHFSHSAPIVLSDGVLTQDWREVTFARTDNPAGIPEDCFSYKGKHGLLTHEGAIALAWTLIAQHSMRHIECRLVFYRLETTWKCERVGLVEMQPLSINQLRDAVKPSEGAQKADTP